MQPKFIDSVLRKQIFNLCEIIRSEVGPVEYQDFLFPILFLKYISDLRLYQNLKSGKRKFLEKFHIPESSNFYFLFSQRFSENIGQKIDFAFFGLEKENFEELEGISSSLDYSSNKLGFKENQNKLLIEILENIEQIALFDDPTEFSENPIWSALDVLTSASPHSGEFFTPLEVANLIAQLLSPSENESIFDPACGSGSLLLACAKLAAGSSNLYGQERNSSAWVRAKMSLLIQGQSPKNIKLGDSIRSPHFITKYDNLEKFDVVLSNPPFGVRDWGLDTTKNDRFNRFKYGIPPKSNGEYAFLAHILAVLKPESGRAAMLVTNGALSRGGAEHIIRSNLVDHGLIHAVISLPGKLFLNTGIPVNIIILKEQKNLDGILFIDARDGFITDKGKNRLKISSLENIVSCYREALIIENFSKFVLFEEIQKNDYILNVQRYISQTEKIVDIDMNELHIRKTIISERLEELDITIDKILLN